MPTANLKLNPTTFSIPAPPSSPTHSILKVVLTPHLTVNRLNSLTSLNRNIRKDADALFEVLVPVGGRVEVNIEVEGVDGLTGYRNEWEAGDGIKEKVINSFDRNRGVLHLERVDFNTCDTITLYPTAATASRAAAVLDLLPKSTPVAHLIKLEIGLTWVGSSATTAAAAESQSDASQVWDELLLSDNEKEKPVSTSACVNDTGPLPKWLTEQLGLATSKLFRSELIKRFPLVFGAAFPTYLARCTPPPALELAFNHCLSFSETHSVPVFERARSILHAIIDSQTALAAHRQAAVDSLLSRGCGTASGSKRQKTGSRSHSSSSSTNDPEGTTLPENSQITRANQDQNSDTATPGPTLAAILVQCLSQIGRERWTRARTAGRGRLSYNRIKLIEEGDVPVDTSPIPHDETAPIDTSGTALSTQPVRDQASPRIAHVGLLQPANLDPDFFPDDLDDLLDDSQLFDDSDLDDSGLLDDLDDLNDPQFFDDDDVLPLRAGILHHDQYHHQHSHSWNDHDSGSSAIDHHIPPSYHPSSQEALRLPHTDFVQHQHTCPATADDLVDDSDLDDLESCLSLLSFGDTATDESSPASLDNPPYVWQSQPGLPIVDSTDLVSSCHSLRPPHIMDDKPDSASEVELSYPVPKTSGHWSIPPLSESPISPPPLHSHDFDMDDLASIGGSSGESPDFIMSDDEDDLL